MKRLIRHRYWASLAMTAGLMLAGSAYAQADKTVTGSPSGTIGATNSIITSGSVAVTNATFQAGALIKLEPGFTVSAGGSFHAFIAPDTTAPSQPTGLSASGVTQTSFTLNWTAATDAFGVTGYDVLRDGAVVVTVTDTTANVTGLTQNTTYTMVVRARDAAGNTTSSASQQVSTVAATAPTFTTQPQSQSAGASSTVTFTANANGDPAPSYQWRKNGGNITGATSATLTLNNVQTSDTGTYSVVASNLAGSATSTNATLTVTAAPIITAQPQGQTIAPTGSVTFSVTATSGSPLSYQWRKNGTNLSGKTAAALSLTNVQASDTAYYDVVVTNSDGSVTSSPAGLIVAEAAGTGDGGTLPATWPNTPKTPVAGDPTVGLTGGQVSVDKSGALTYSVPLWVVPGTAGMQPQLALNYSSQAGSGIAGFGWSLGGVSAIARGPQTRAIDDHVHGIDFTSADRYYLDGQRLIAISGADGANNTEYRTEIDSMSKIVSYGSGSSPSSFKVWTKAGLTIEFGTTGDSAAEANNQGTPRTEIMTWAVSKISDTAGNYMTFTYSEDQANGEHRLTQIDYTGNGTLAPTYASVKFIYEARTDMFRGYVAGSKVSSTQRLKKIESYFGTALVRRYTLDYVNRDLVAGDHLGRSVLTKLHEADGNGLEYSPLTFDYDTSGVGFTQDSDWTPPALLGRYNSDGRGTGFVDLNGDGRPDFIQYRKNSSDGIVAQGAWFNTVTSSGSHWVAASSAFYPPVALAKDGVTDIGTRLADVNGDGFTDMFDGFGDCYTGSATGFALDTYWSIPLPSAYAGYPDAYATYSKPTFIDLDGDGRPDFVAKATIHNINNNIPNLVTPAAGATDSTDGSASIVAGKGGISTNVMTSPNTAQVNVAWLNKPEGWQQYPSYYPPLDMEKGSTFIDVNGDGLPDQVQYWRDQGTAIKNVVLNTGSGWAAPLGASSPLVPPEMLSEQTGTSSTAPVGTEFVDLNGDGLVDVVHRNDSTANIYAYGTRAWLNTGNGWVTAPSGLLPPFELTDDVTPQGVALLDINSDGYPDLVQAWGSARDVRLGNGQEWSGSAGSAGPSGYALVRQLAQTGRPVTGTDFVDLDGDGAVDQIWSWSEGGDAWNDSAYGSAHGAALNLAKPAGRLNKVTNGFGVEVSAVYAPLTERDASGNFTVYDRGANPQPAAAATDIIAPLYVVKTVKNDDGAGGTRDISYRYGGMRVHPKRGNLGFAVMTTTDVKTGIQTTTKFNQVFPYIGMPDSSETKSGSTLLSSTSTTYDVKPLNSNKTWLPYAKEVVQKSFELSSVPADNGVFISGTKTTSTIDDYGNATQVAVASINSDGSAEGFSKTVVSTFAPPDTTKWYLGRLKKSVVTAVAIGTPNLTRTSAFTYYDSTTGLLQDEIVEPKYKANGDADADGDDTLRTHYVYDSFGNKQTVTVTGFDFTINGTKVASTRTTTTVYDAKGRFPDHSTNALNHTEIYGYDQKLGVMTSLQGPNGLTTSWSLDTFGNKTQESRADGTATNIAVHWAGTGAPVGAKYFVETTATGAPPSIVFYDKLGRVIQTASLDGNANILYQDTVYDSYGRAYAVSLPYRGGSSAAYWTQTTSYDLLNRPLTVQTPDDQNGAVSTTFAYKGLTTQVTDAKARVAQTVKNSQGWVITSVRDVNGTAATVTTSYDAFGNPASVTASGSTTVMSFDTRGRKNGMTDPDMGGTAHPWSYGYNAFGELVSQTDAKGQTTRMAYDSLGRLTQRAESEGTTTWTYDTATHASPPAGAPGTWIGKLASVTAPGAYSESYEYDGYGRPAKVVRNIDGAPYSVFQHYDGAGHPLVTVYPGGFQTKNVYNALGFLKEVWRTDGSTDGSGARLNPNLDLYWHADSYALDGRVNGETLGNGVTGDRVYSPATGRLLGAGVGLGTSNTAQFLAYVYDRVGNVTVRQDGPSNRREAFQYDTLDRLTNYALSGAAGVDVGYDDNGNIKSKTGVGSYAYDGSHGGPHAVTGVTGGGLQAAAGYEYDDNGNMTKRAGRTLTWTSFNQLQHVDDGNGHFSDFSFGAAHERVKQVAHNGTTIYVGGIWEKFTTGGGTVEKNYIMAPTGRIAVATFGNGLVVPGTVNYFHTDGLGSITAVSNASGAIIQRFAFDAWGKRLTLDLNTLAPSPTTTANNGYLTRGYTDHEQLDDLGLIHMNGRVYDPVLGRFLSADPNVDGVYDSQGYNRYSYCGNNPMNRIDPSGYLSLKEILPAVIAIVVTVVAIVCQQYWVLGYQGTFWGALSTGVSTFSSVVVGGAAGGFASGFSGSLLNGGSIGDAFKSGVIGAAWGAASAAVAFGVGQYVDGLNLSSEMDWGARAIAHGVTQGGLTEAQGGEFRHGFYAAAFSSAASPAIGKLFPNSDQIAQRTATAAVIGGTASAIGGGKFANGAVTGAFAHLFNAEATRPKPNANMQISAEGIDMIADLEGFSGKIYKDQAGYPTIGYGHKLTAGEAAKYGNGISESDARKLLVSDVQKAESAVRRLVTVPLEQGSYDSLVSFTYNVGSSAFAKSTLLTQLNAGNYISAPSEMARWKYAGGAVSQGLVYRRWREGWMFEGLASPPAEWAPK